MTTSLELSAEQENALIIANRHALWRAGDLSWKLDDTQAALYEEIRSTGGKQYVTEGARKLGKTYLHGVIALETALRNPGKQINWCSGTAIACQRLLVPILEEISADAPPECRGKFNGQLVQWQLPNGAFIQLVGAETRRDCERARGPSAILNILDEAGFIDLLEYLLDSILAPQLRRIRRLVGSFVGMTLLCSTTPYTPAHPFCRISDVASVSGDYANRTIYDSGFETPEQIERYISDEAAKKGLTVEAFKETSTFKREFLSQRVVDTDAVVFPEFFTARSRIVQQWPRPIGFEKYIYKRVAIDPGMADKTGILYGYVDFTAAKVVVEAESLLTKPNTKQIAEEVTKVEARLWEHANPSRISRVIDDPHGRTVADLWDLHRLRVGKATKNDREASIGLIRTWLASGKLVIDPSCTELQKQLLTAVKNRAGTDFAETEEGHFDLAAALMYFVRDLSLTANPYPQDFDVLTGRQLPDHHPLVARREALGQGKATGGLSGAILSGNRYVQAQLKKR